MTGIFGVAAMIDRRPRPLRLANISHSWGPPFLLRRHARLAKINTRSFALTKPRRGFEARRQR